jgi:hypothetical protein
VQGEKALGVRAILERSRSNWDTPIDLALGKIVYAQSQCTWMAQKRNAVSLSQAPYSVAGNSFPSFMAKNMDDLPTGISDTASIFAVSILISLLSAALTI